MSEQQPFYHLRPNKYIDRNLFVQHLVQIKKLLPIEAYTYIGFGSFLFDDFKLMHTELDIVNMVSIESDAKVCERADFNKPYNCIAIENTTSSDFISGLSLDEGNYIIWLDYTDPKALGSQFADFGSILEMANPNDIIRITLNANPSSLGDKSENETVQEVHIRRLKKLQERISAYIPSDVVADDMTAIGYPILLLRCLKKASMKVLDENPPYQTRFFFPLFTTVYRDGQQMVTLTGIVLNNHEHEESIRSCLEKCEQSTFEWNKPCIIRIPPLTQKEILHINNLLPNKTAKQQIMEKFAFSFQGEDTVESYMSFYKYYPNFHHVNL